MFSLCQRKTAQRKYIDLINEATGKWPNWDPPRTFLAGDFGTINKKTGRLVVEGNIYTHVDIKEIASQYPPLQEAELETYSVCSNEVKELEVKADDGVYRDVPTDQGVILKYRWDKHGAILVMYKAKMTRVPEDFFVASTHLPVLKGKCIVNQVWHCPGYYICFSERSSEQLTISLRTSAERPDPFSWFAEGFADIRQQAYRPDGVYTPLLSLKSLQKPLLRLSGLAKGCLTCSVCKIRQS